MHACGPRACIYNQYSVAPHVARRPEPLASPPDTSSYHHSPHMNISVPCQRSSLSLSRSLYSPTYGCRAPICSTPRRSMSPSPLSMRVPQRAYSARGGYGAGESVRRAAPSSARRDLAHSPRVSASTHVSALKSARHTRATRAPHARHTRATHPQQQQYSSSVSSVYLIAPGAPSVHRTQRLCGQSRLAI